MSGADPAGPVLLACERLSVRRGERDVVRDVTLELQMEASVQQEAA